MTLANMLVPAAGINTPEHWQRWEEHGECETATIDLENGYFVMKCTDHNVPHIIAVKQS
jgi:hypothetical protein